MPLFIAAVTVRGLVKVRGWLIRHRSSFQSLLCTAAHLDADVRRLVSCAEPVLFAVELRGLELKLAAFFFSSYFFGGGLWDPAVILPFIRLDSVRQHPVIQSPVPCPPGPIMEHKDGGTQRIQRGSCDVTDIDITSAIIKPKLAK